MIQSEIGRQVCAGLGGFILALSMYFLAGLVGCGIIIGLGLIVIGAFRP